ncbi:LysR family transcriptional regulator [Microvirga pudoricolor]|uniref:LysR family transcriptional regulator n=1 Tax=Microvirga pudoricolor TaxID=2778729 RepID=UPI00194DCD4A|nr:LysR family transcriptional regulator [Microvirga pudoricolor]MBM6596225.1 LysR family transcriptional regulator [Microvirga pudoricolor]
MGDPSWDDIRIFLAIAEAGSLSAAAVALALSQPTVGRRLKVLEDELGLRLVERISNRIELTEEGQLIRDRALAMSGVADGVLREAYALSGRRPDAVRITATTSIALFLADRLDDLSRRADGLEIVIDASRERSNLARREADIAIRMRRLPEEGDLVARKVARLGFGIYGPAGADPAALPVIGLPRSDREPSQSAYLDAWAAGRPVRARLSELSLRRRAAQALGAATLLPCWLGDPDPSLTRLIAPPRELREDVYLIARRDSRGDAPVGAVAQALADLFRAHATALAGEI